jgi:hypothetical protein
MSVNLHEVPPILKRACRTGVNLHITGEPGCGKTRIIEQTAAELKKADEKFGIWTMYTPSLSPVDFVAMMPDTAKGTLRPYHSELIPNGFQHPDLKGIVFLGERDNADPATNKVLQKYINNEDMGGLIKPRGVIVVSDSNELDHRSGAVQQSLALLSRSRVVQVRVEPDIYLKHFSEIGLNVYAQAFFSLRKELISTFAQVLKNREYKVWSNPRSIERLGISLDDAEAAGEKLSDDEIIGDVGEGVGREFIGFLHAARELVSYDEIKKTPKKAAKPDKLSDVYAVIAMLAHSVIDADFENVRTYVERFGTEVQVLFLRLLMSSPDTTRKIPCTRTKAYTSWFAQPELRSAVLG